MTTKRLIRITKALFLCARGSIAVELGLLAPVAATILIGLFEFTGAFEQSMDLATAARAGVEYAVKNPTDTTGIENAAIASGAISPTGLTVTVSLFC
jgi:Flp pilus assembly protein TadG